MFWDHFLVARSPSSVWNNCNIYRFGTHVFLAFCHCEAYSFAFPLQNVDLDKHISPRRSEANLPPFSVKGNPGRDRHNFVRLPSLVEKWSQKMFVHTGKRHVTYFVTISREMIAIYKNGLAHSHMNDEKLQQPNFRKISLITGKRHVTNFVT